MSKNIVTMSKWKRQRKNARDKLVRLRKTFFHQVGEKITFNRIVWKCAGYAHQLKLKQN